MFAPFFMPNSDPPSHTCIPPRVRPAVDLPHPVVVRGDLVWADFLTCLADMNPTRGPDALGPFHPRGAGWSPIPRPPFGPLPPRLSSGRPAAKGRVDKVTARYEKGKEVPVTPQSFDVLDADAGPSRPTSLPPSSPMPGDLPSGPQACMQTRGGGGGGRVYPSPSEWAGQRGPGTSLPPPLRPPISAPWWPPPSASIAPHTLPTHSTHTPALPGPAGPGGTRRWWMPGTTVHCGLRVRYPTVPSNNITGFGISHLEFSPCRSHIFGNPSPQSYTCFFGLFLVRQLRTQLRYHNPFF